MDRKLINNILVFIIIISILVLAFFIIKPIFVSIIFGLLFAYIFNPVYKKINKKIKNDTISASILLILITILFLAPIIYFTPVLINQMFNIFDIIKQINFAELITTFFPFLGKEGTAYSILLNLNNLPGKTLSSLMEYFFSIVMNLPQITLQILVFLFTLFYAMKDAERLKEYTTDISPFSKATERRFLREFRGITNAIILGQVVIGIIQGLTLGIGLWFLGVENVLSWTIITVILSIIPIIGPWLVWIPLSIFMISNGEITKAIILVLYGGLFVSNIDNVIRPYLLNRSVKLHVMVTIIGTIGGLYFLGIVGLILGPLILAYALIIIDFYREGRLDELYREIKQNKTSIANYEIKN
jgi:predicted PurR-regulated permease PerM